MVSLIESNDLNCFVSLYTVAGESLCYFCAVFLFKRKYFNLRNLLIDMGGNFIIDVVNRMINEIYIHIGLCVHS